MLLCRTALLAGLACILRSSCDDLLGVVVSYSVDEFPRGVERYVGGD